MADVRQGQNQTAEFVLLHLEEKCVWAVLLWLSIFFADTCCLTISMFVDEMVGRETAGRN